MASFNWAKKRCQSCRKKFKKGAPFHTLRLGTMEGILELEICDSCADFYDKSADVMLQHRRNLHNGPTEEE